MIDKADTYNNHSSSRGRALRMLPFYCVKVFFDCGGTNSTSKRERAGGSIDRLLFFTFFRRTFPRVSRRTDIYIFVYVRTHQRSHFASHGSSSRAVYIMDHEASSLWPLQALSRKFLSDKLVQQLTQKFLVTGVSIQDDFVMGVGATLEHTHSDCCLHEAIQA